MWTKQGPGARLKQGKVVQAFDASCKEGSKCVSERSAK